MAALDRLREEEFDLRLMDVQMPDMDGHEATRRLRSGAAGELNRRMRVVALTAGALAEECVACLAAGMNDFILRPLPAAIWRSSRTPFVLQSGVGSSPAPRHWGSRISPAAASPLQAARFSRLI
jgi:CheY-like chemotaxis protein